MTGRRRFAARRSAALCAALAVVLASPTPRAWSGSTEPALAIADVAASVEGSVVTLDVTANYDHGDVVRLGYPLAVVATEGSTIARLFLDGRVTLESGGGAPALLAGAPGVVAIAPLHIAAVLPAAMTAGGTVAVRLEASFDGGTLRSNTVQVQW